VLRDHERTVCPAATFTPGGTGRLRRRTSTSTQSTVRMSGSGRFRLKKLVRRFLEIICWMTYMQPCDACCDLVGKPSSVPPHGDLAASGVIAVGPPGNMTKVSSSWNARSAATGCTKTRRMEIRRTNGLLANDRQTGRQNDGHALCVAHTGDDQRIARLGRHRFVSLTRMTWISCANKWAIE